MWEVDRPCHALFVMIWLDMCFGLFMFLDYELFDITILCVSSFVTLFHPTTCIFHAFDDEKLGQVFYLVPSNVGCLVW